ncbi:MAG TPA: ribosomal-processing cysteine protease Prp [Lachnospiraceae bacterium]|nr:ribosomal-processing cysteine protease Prp [Lachnospiraceae bacterium]
MITLRIREDGFQMVGHAGYNPGNDIVCSAVSALTCTLLESLRVLTDSLFHAETGSGKTIVEWQALSDTGKKLVDAWFLGIALINLQYNCISYD